MVQEYKKIGVTTDGYRGKRAILQERVIEGLSKPSFENNALLLTVDSPKTIYLTNENFSNGYYIVLPDATTLWKNWQISIINDSSDSCPIYYYSATDQSNLYKEVSAGNMITCILLDNNSNSNISGTWTTFRTTETSDAEELYKYTSDVFEEVDITWNELLRDTSTVTISLGNVLRGTSVKSIYIKPTEQFLAEDSDESSISQIDLKVSIGTEDNPTLFMQNYDLSGAITDTNFTKDLYDEMLSTTSNVGLIATFSGNDIQNLISGDVKIVIEKARLIDPTILKNPIVQTQIPIGIIMNYIFSNDNNKAPDGYWRLNGSIFPNATTAIPDFVNKLKIVDASLSGEKLIVTSTVWNNIYNTYGSCGKFCWVGTGLRFPAINCFIKGLSDLNQLAKLNEPNLNHYHIFGYNNQNNQGSFVATNSTIDGTLPTVNNQSGYRDWNGSNGGGYFHPTNTSYLGNMVTTFPIYQSNNSEMYSNSDPLNIRYPYIISIYNSFQNSSAIVLDEIIESSVNKANINLDNLSLDNIDSNTKNRIISWSLPNYSNAIAINIPEIGSGKYTTPTEGYISIILGGSYRNGYRLFANNMVIWQAGDDINSGTKIASGLIPIRRNVELDYDTNGTAAFETKTTYFIALGV